MYTFIYRIIVVGLLKPVETLIRIYCTQPYLFILHWMMIFKPWYHERGNPHKINTYTFKRNPSPIFLQRLLVCTNGRFLALLLKVGSKYRIQCCHHTFLNNSVINYYFHHSLVIFTFDPTNLHQQFLFSAIECSVFAYSLRTRTKHNCVNRNKLQKIAFIVIFLLM